jgi:hypothetical protein
MKNHHRWFAASLLLISALIAAWAFSGTSAQAATVAQQGGHSDCLNCHNDSLIGVFNNGATLTLSMHEDEFNASVHGGKIGCVACHDEHGYYPHPNSGQDNCFTCHNSAKDGSELRVKVNFDSPRDLAFNVSDACAKCHDNAEELSGSLHEKFREQGNPGAPVCSDCHGAHNIHKPNVPRSQVSRTCAKCHPATFSTYESSVHGEALMADSNPDVPTCEDCHGAHSVQGPDSPNFRNAMIQVCGDCHADEERMGKYDISAGVFDTYLADFHGRTVDFFRQNESGRPSQAATCYDCHGVHNIRRVDDPLSMVYPENLQETCSHCHADADIRFPDAWLGHYVPTWEDTPSLYAVNAIYAIAVPGLIGGFLVYIALDAVRRIRHRFFMKSH